VEGTFEHLAGFYNMLIHMLMPQRTNITNRVRTPFLLSFFAFWCCTATTTSLLVKCPRVRLPFTCKASPFLRGRRSMPEPRRNPLPSLLLSSPCHPRRQPGRLRSSLRRRRSGSGRHQGGKLYCSSRLSAALPCLDKAAVVTMPLARSDQSM